jgi:uncharacterized protein
MDEKDRLGGKLRDKERAEEDLYFAQRDRELLEKLKKEKEAEEKAAERQKWFMRCPKCGVQLATVQHHGVTVDECPSCQGMWLDRGELETLAQRENEGWLSRWLRRNVVKTE